MNYQQTLTYLYARLPVFQRDGASAYKPDLNNALLFDAELNHPHQHYTTIHVGGTNGKGSVSNLIASVLQHTGLKVGLYTSPHLKDFRERIRINGKPISKRYVCSFVEKETSFIEKLNPSFFETTMCMAFSYFAEEKVDIAVIEVGLGGRLDSTNIIHPILSIITNISFDHMNLLGDSLEKIALEKAGVIKKNSPILMANAKRQVLFLHKSKCHTRPLIFCDQLLLKILCSKKRFY
jgi:dihydrofolate synthase/folylpolyglutamate synthase